MVREKEVKGTASYLLFFIFSFFHHRHEISLGRKKKIQFFWKIVKKN
jgi:hypothetical protein